MDAAEAAKWAPGGAAFRGFAERFLDPDVDERLARAISPARVPERDPDLSCALRHELSRQVASSARRCDVCCADIVPSAPLLACTICDHDVCRSCAKLL